MGRFLNKHVKWLIGIFLALLLALALFGNEERKWFGVGMLASVAVSLALARRDAFSDVIADPAMRGTIIWLVSLIIWLVSLIICAAFGFGRNKAYDIITGHEYFVVDQASIQHVTGVRISRAGELKYLGHAGEYLFLLAPDSSIEILRADAAPALVIQRVTWHTRQRAKSDGP